MGRTQSWRFWSIFGAQFIPGKPKILPKTRIFPETTSLWLLNNTSTKSQINQRVLIKSIKKINFSGKNRLFKIKNRPVNKNKEVRGQVITTLSEAPNSVLTIGQNIFVIPWLKLVLFKFWSHFFLSCSLFFRGDTQPIEKNLLDFQMQSLMLNLLNKNII